MKFLNGDDAHITCFGYVDGRLYGGRRHHMAIMQFILAHGYTFEELMEAEQAWGWVESSASSSSFVYRLSTDAAAIDPALVPEINAAWEHLTGKSANVSTVSQPTNEDKYAPNYQGYYGEKGYYKTDPVDMVYVYDTHTGWQGKLTPTSPEQFTPPKKREKPSWIPEGLSEVPTKFKKKPAPVVQQGLTQEDQIHLEDYEQATQQGYYLSPAIIQEYKALQKKKQESLDALGFTLGDKLRTKNNTVYEIVAVNPGKVTLKGVSGPHIVGGVSEHDAENVKSWITEGVVTKEASLWKEALRMKFVYDVQTGAVAGDPYNQHYDILEQHGLSEEELERHAFGSSARYIFGAQEEGYPPFIYSSDKLPPEHVKQAVQAYQDWLAEEHPGLVLHTGAFLDEQDFDRYSWLIDHKGQLKIAPGSDQHHVDLGWSGAEPATGDILEGFDGAWNRRPGEITLRVLSLEPHIDWSDVVDRVQQEWDRLHPDKPIDHFENESKNPYHLNNDEDYDDEGYHFANWQERDLTKQAECDILVPMENKIAAVLGEPLDENGWKIYQMESGEYQNHHAIVVDRANKHMLINYHGHHYPMMTEIGSKMIPFAYEASVQGHYRLEPSTTEPFKEGYGYHDKQATPEEEAIIAQYVAAYHGVDDPYDAWIANKPATTTWLTICGKASKVKWQAVWDRDENALYLWNRCDCGDTANHVAAFEAILPGLATKTGTIKKAHRYVQAEGILTSPTFVIAPGAANPMADTARVGGLLDTALNERYNEVELVTFFAPPKKNQKRFMVKKNGSVIVGDYKSHYDLIQANEGTFAAMLYNQAPGDEAFPFMGGGFVEGDGTIRIIHSPGEPDFDPKSVATNVMLGVGDEGIETTGKIIYEDWRTTEKTTKEFSLFGS